SLRLLDMLKNPATNPDITQIIRMIEFGIDEDRTIRFCWCPRRLTRFSKEVDELAKSCAEISSQPIPFCSISYTHQMIRYNCPSKPISHNKRARYIRASQLSVWFTYYANGKIRTSFAALFN